MKVEAVVNDIKREFIELCCNKELCDECELNISPACCIWYAFRYLNNNGIIHTDYSKSEDNICNTYFKDVMKPTYGKKWRPGYTDYAVKDFVTWLKENGYLKGVE